MKTNWLVKKLGEVAIINPPKSEVSNIAVGTAVSFVSMASISPQSGTITNIESRNIEDVRKGYTYFANNDVLFAKITPCMENGKVAIAHNLQNGIGFGTTEVHVLRPTSQVLPEWIYSVVNNEQFRADAKRHMTGTAGQQRVPKEYLENAKIPIPPKNEQKKILSKLEKVLVKIEEAYTLRQKSLDETNNLDSKRKPVTKSVREKGSYPYYGASGIVDYVREYLFDEDLLLISEDGANLLARTYPIAFSISGKTWVNNHAHVLKFESKSTQKIVEYYLNSIDISSYVSGTAQPKLNQENLNKISIPLPDLNEQEEIVAYLDGSSEKVQALQKLQEEQLQELELLKQSVLHNAFQGEL